MAPLVSHLCVGLFCRRVPVVYGVLFSSQSVAIPRETADFGCTLANIVTAWLTTAMDW